MNVRIKNGCHKNVLVCTAWTWSIFCGNIFPAKENCRESGECPISSSLMPFKKRIKKGCRYPLKTSAKPTKLPRLTFLCGKTKTSFPGFFLEAAFDYLPAGQKMGWRCSYFIWKKWHGIEFTFFKYAHVAICTLLNPQLPKQQDYLGRWFKNEHDCDDKSLARNL